MGLLYPYDLYFVEHIYVSSPNDPAESAELFPLPEPGMQSQRPEEATMSGFPLAAWEFSFFLRSREIELTTMEKVGFPFIIFYQRCFFVPVCLDLGPGVVVSSMMIEPG